MLSEGAPGREDWIGHLFKVSATCFNWQLTTKTFNDPATIFRCLFYEVDVLTGDQGCIRKVFIPKE